MHAGVLHIYTNTFNNNMVTCLVFKDALFHYILTQLYCIYIGPPSPIKDLTITDRDICNTTISGLSWTASSGDLVCGPISYVVTVLPSGGVEIMSVNDTHYDISGLTPDTSYNIAVISSNVAGATEPVIIMANTPSLDEALPSGK